MAIRVSSENGLSPTPPSDPHDSEHMFLIVSDGLVGAATSPGFQTKTHPCVLLRLCL